MKLSATTDIAAIAEAVALDWNNRHEVPRTQALEELKKSEPRLVAAVQSGSPRRVARALEEREQRWRPIEREFAPDAWSPWAADLGAADAERAMRAYQPLAKALDAVESAARALLRDAEMTPDLEVREEDVRHALAGVAPRHAALAGLAIAPVETLGRCLVATATLAGEDLARAAQRAVVAGRQGQAALVAVAIRLLNAAPVCTQPVAKPPSPREAAILDKLRSGRRVSEAALCTVLKAAGRAASGNNVRSAIYRLKKKGWPIAADGLGYRLEVAATTRTASKSA